MFIVKNRLVVAIFISCILAGLFALVADGAEAGSWALCTADHVNVRTGPGTDFSVVGELNKGNQVAVIDKSGDWLKVQLERGPGWVAGWFMKLESDAAVPVISDQRIKTKHIIEITASHVNVRKGPGTSYAVIGEVNTGENYSAVAKSGDWYKIKYQLGYGWVAGWLLKLASEGGIPGASRGGDERNRGEDGNLTPDPEGEEQSNLGEQSLAGKVVFLDPGHGGHDPGAVGSAGTYEKDCVLDIANKAAEVLKNLGATVFMSRDEDIFVNLTEIAEEANSSCADIFVSIHNNSNENRDVQGISTYYYKPPGESSEQGQPRIKLARSLQSRLVADLGLKDIGLCQAGFVVLKNTLMPAVLLEIGFISNADEEKLLREKEFRDQAGSAIAYGIKDYFE